MDEKVPNVSLGMGTYILRDEMTEYVGDDNKSSHYAYFGERSFTQQMKCWWKGRSEDNTDYHITIGGGSAGDNEEYFRAVVQHEKLHINKDSFEIVEMLKNKYRGGGYFEKLPQLLEAHNIIEDCYVNNLLSADSFDAFVRHATKDITNPETVKLFTATTGYILDRDVLLKVLDETKIEALLEVQGEWKELRDDMIKRKLNIYLFLKKIVDMLDRLIKILNIPKGDSKKSEKSEYAGSGYTKTQVLSNKPITKATNPEISSLATVLKQLKVIKPVEISKENYMGKKLNRAFITKTKPLAKPFHTKTEIVSEDIPTYYFVIDDSGSMCGQPAFVIRVFLLAMREAGIKFKGVFKNTSRCTSFTQDDEMIIGSTCDTGDTEDFKKLPKYVFDEIAKADKTLFVSDFAIEGMDYAFLKEVFATNKKIVPVLAGIPHESRVREAVKLFGENENVKLVVCKSANDFVTRIMGVR